MIVKTSLYSRDEIKKVLETRIRIEGLLVNPAALEVLADKGDATSLRFVLQLLTPASILARIAGRNEVAVQDVGELTELFLDSKRSTGVLMELDKVDRRF